MKVLINSDTLKHIAFNRDTFASELVLASAAGIVTASLFTQTNTNAIIATTSIAVGVLTGHTVAKSLTFSNRAMRSLLDFFKPCTLEEELEYLATNISTLALGALAGAVNGLIGAGTVIGLKEIGSILIL